MSVFQALILGLVQGLTEFLPVSSSGHLVAIPLLFNWQPHSLAFDTTLHLGTAFALLVYFRNELFTILSAFIRDLFLKKLSFKQYSTQGILAQFILIGCLPAGILGFLFDDLLESNFRGGITVALFLLAGSVLMFFAEKLGKKSTCELSYSKSLFIGIMQSLALFPGVSRSGATISGGLLLNLDRETAAKFSFLLSFPIVLIAGVYKLATSFTELTQISSLTLIVGFLASVLSGIFAISFLMKFLRSNGLLPFVIYRIVLAFILLVMFLI